MMDKVDIEKAQRLLAQERMPDGDDLAKQKLLEEWDEIRTPFLRVIWVKEMGKGVKCLK